MNVADVVDFKADLSLNTLIITVVLGLVGWGIKGVAWALAETCKQLIQTLLRTITKVEVLESKIVEVLALRSEVDKIKFDLNNLYAKVKEIQKTQ